MNYCHFYYRVNVKFGLFYTHLMPPGEACIICSYRFSKLLWAVLLLVYYFLFRNSIVSVTRASSTMSPMSILVYASSKSHFSHCGSVYIISLQRRPASFFSLISANSSSSNLPPKTNSLRGNVPDCVIAI